MPLYCGFGANTKADLADFNIDYEGKWMLLCYGGTFALMFINIHFSAFPS